MPESSFIVNIAVMKHIYVYVCQLIPFSVKILAEININYTLRLKLVIFIHNNRKNTISGKTFAKGGRAECFQV